VLEPVNIDYLRELGVNTILLLPTGEFPGDNSWGYNPAHIFAVESSYGGPAALKRFIDRAHEHGFAILLDVVYNHFGPNDLPTWQFDGWFEHYDGEDMGGIYFYNDWRARTPWGKKNRPDYGRPEVRQFIRDNALMWLEEYRADGLRFDMTVFVRNVDGSNNDAWNDARNLGGSGYSLLQWLNDEINRRQPWKITMAEDLQVNPAVTKSSSGGGIGFDTQWDARFLHPVRQALTTPNDDDRDIAAMRVAIEGNYYNGNPLERVIYTESHDEVAFSNGKRRLVEDITPGQADSWFAKKRSTLGAAMVFTSPGIPMIFQAQEILEWIPFGDQNPVDWDKYDRFRGIYYLYRDLIRLRRNWFNNTRGLKGSHVNVYYTGPDKVLAFHRWDQGGPGDDVVIVLNFKNRSYSSYTIGFPRAGKWRVRFNSDWNGYDQAFGNFFSYDTEANASPLQGMPCSGNIAIAPYTCLILSQ
jgi:1,4-alpha-glucan branching enzyme